MTNTAGTTVHGFPGYGQTDIFPNITDVLDGKGKILKVYVDTYTFESTEIHDQGPLIDQLMWEDIDLGHLAATFQGISNFKRILFTETNEELNYSLSYSRKLIDEIESYLNPSTK